MAVAQNPTQDPMESRVAALETETRSRRLPIEARVADLEGQLKGMKPRQKDAWEKLQSVSGIITALVTAAIGFYLTGVVNSGLERNKLESANVEKMRDLIVKLNAEDIQPGDAEAIGLTLAAFGPFAVPPLIAALSTPTQVRARAAENALLAVSLTDARPVCATLGTVLENRGRRYTVLMHRRTITLLGKIQCDGAPARALTQYLAFIDGATGKAGIARVANALDDALPVGKDEIDGLHQALCATPQLAAAAGCLARVAP